jgi:hypothetical protein
MKNSVELSCTPFLFAADYIYANDFIGVAYVNGHETWVGKFLEHSEKPNCMLVTTSADWGLWSITPIFIGDKLTINKTLYGVDRYTG